MIVIVESFLLAIALCVDSFVVSTTSAFKSKMTYRKGLELAIIFGVCQGVFPLLGALLGSSFKNLIASVDHWVAFGLLFVVGFRMILDAFHKDEDNKSLDVTKFGVMVLLGIATSIDAFVVGIGFGLSSTLYEIIVKVLMITIITFLVSIMGVYMGKRNIPIPEKWVTIFAGLVLIALGASTLIEHLLE